MVECIVMVREECKVLLDVFNKVIVCYYYLVLIVGSLVDL